MLIAHGGEEDVVPPEQSIALHRALSRLGRAHEYVVYPGEGHNIDDLATAPISSPVSAHFSPVTIHPDGSCSPEAKRVYRTCFLDIVKHAEAGSDRGRSAELRI